MGFVISCLFILISEYTVLFQPIEAFAVDIRFQLSKFSTYFIQRNDHILQNSINPHAHEAIEIIGIDNSTVTNFDGFPFSWDHYVQFIKALGKSQYNQLVFDLFFLDEKKDGIHKEVNTDLFKDSLSSILEKKKTTHVIMADYPFEIQTPSIDIREQVKLDDRIELLKKYRILNVIPTIYDKKEEWVKYPEVPIVSITNNLSGIGYANIRPDKSGINRSMPLVIKWGNQFYPSISLLMAMQYYKVTFKDIELKLGSYIKISNISKEPIYTKILDSDGLPVFDYQGKIKVKSRDRMEHPNPERTVVIPINAEGFMQINFIGSVASFPSIPFHIVANSPKNYFEGENDAFKDKILLVGVYYATGVAKDLHATPFSNDVAGIEHHAHALNTILKQDFLHYVPRWVNYIIYLSLSIVLGLFIPLLTIRQLGAFVLLLGILFLGEVFVVFHYFNIIHSFFIPYIEITMILVVCLSYRAIFEEANVSYIKSTFSKFVSQNVVEQLLHNPELLKLGGDKQEITVFFSDIRGFTNISEKLSPEALVHLLNDYLSTMTDVCLNYKGTIDKYIGDAIMAFWGAPIPYDDHAYLCCLSALEQIRALKILSKKWESESTPIIDIGIGINTGLMIVGNVGSVHRMDYTVMGDSVNLGSRIESLTKVYGVKIIISEFTYAHVKDKVIVRELDIIRVKGKLQPVTIYELMGLKDESDFVTYHIKNDAKR